MNKKNYSLDWTSQNEIVDLSGGLAVNDIITSAERYKNGYSGKTWVF
jgi:hypothetical protein